MAAAWHSVLRCALVCGAFIIGIHSHELQHRRSASGQLPARSSSSASVGGGGAVRTSGRSILEASAVAASTDSAAEARCPALSRDLLQSVAKQNTVMLAVANEKQWDFTLNWLEHLQAAEISYAVVAAADVLTSQRLAALGQACFEHIDDEIPKLGLTWGEEGWRRMTWAKVFVLDMVADWGFDIVVSDVDVVWFKDPTPLFTEHPNADLLFGEDGTQSLNEAGDAGLEVTSSPFHDFNTGVYLMRHGNRTTAWVHAWRQFFAKCTNHDQHCAYDLMRDEPGDGRDANDPRLHTGWKGQLWMGVMPPSIFMNAHTHYLQQLHKVKQVEPYAVHLTWTYNGAAGKRARLRDMGLWFDPPNYYSSGSFVTVDLDLPEKPPGYNDWNENEDMVTFYLETIHAQLQQAYVGMALAVASKRAFVLPTLQCYCEKLWYEVVRCRVVDAQAMPFPVPCPQDYLFDPAHYADNPVRHGTPMDIRESSFLDNERTPQEVKESLLIIQPSAALQCTDCVKEEPGEGGIMLLMVPPALPDAQLLPLLEPYSSYRVWRFSFAGVGSTQRAYGGFSDAAAAQAFDQRMEWMTTDFCCRREEEAPRYHKTDAIVVKLNMTSEFKYSAMSNAVTAQR
ncbi:hypothetical protein D9Q98_005423 [Chlorella vulgaris]|uniref:Glycosyltransferase n=1 Tax=Chlorella vulgaris TaxID=3077 RepID=A0A9D4TM09_CHLVU|nr:hypothetical protein D9Q98_005423 [Chlorella vulgaris]